MWQFLRRSLSYFLVGFVITFVIYLFIRFSADAVFLGIVIAAVGGIALMIGLLWLEKRFEGPKATGGSTT